MSAPPKAGYLEPPPPRVLAHRGLAVHAPENTLLAFAHALAAGATHIETDVHASSDGIAIISHDADLRRAAGRPERIAELTAVELREVDLGEKQGYVTLREALDAFPEARFNIDLKVADAVAPAVTAVIAARAAHRVLLTSFDGRRSRAAVRALPGVATSASTLRIAAVLVSVSLRLGIATGWLLRTVVALQIPERRYGITVLSPRLLVAAHRSGVEVHIWTVNDPADMRRLLDAGVDGLVTDRADVAVRVIGEAGTGR